MVSWITILGLCLFVVVLCLRVAAWKARPVQSSPRRRMKLARILAVALLTFLAISMRLSRTIDSLDGKPHQPVRWWEQILGRY